MRRSFVKRSNFLELDEIFCLKTKNADLDFTDYITHANTF